MATATCFIFLFVCTKGVDPANPSTSTKTNLLHTPPFVGLLHGASPACCFCRCCGLTKDHTVQCVSLSSCFGIIKLVGCVQETHGQYLILLFVSAWQSLSLISCTSKVLKDDCLKEPQLPPFLASVFQFLGRRIRAARLRGRVVYTDGKEPQPAPQGYHLSLWFFGWRRRPKLVLPSCIGVCCWGGQVANCLLKKTLFRRSSLFIS